MRVKKRKEEGEIQHQSKNTRRVISNQKRDVTKKKGVDGQYAKEEAEREGIRPY